MIYCHFYWLQVYIKSCLTMHFSLIILAVETHTNIRRLFIITNVNGSIYHHFLWGTNACVTFNRFGCSFFCLTVSPIDNCGMKCQFVVNEVLVVDWCIVIPLVRDLVHSFSGFGWFVDSVVLVEGRGSSNNSAPWVVVYIRLLGQF